MARAAGVLEARWFLPAVLTAAVVLRIAHLAALRSSPFYATLQLDHQAYDEWGLRIAQGDWIGQGVFFVDPLYAYFLGVLYAVFGHSLLAVRIVQLVLAVATCWLTARIGSRVLGSRALGNVAALLVAFFIPAVHYEATIEKTTLSVFLFALALDLYLAASPRAALLSGLALGLAALARGNLLLFVPIDAMALLLDRRSEEPAWQRAGLFVLGALAVIGVTTARNAAVGGELVLTTANLGQNFYIGQNRENQLGGYYAPAFVRPDPRYEEGDYRTEAEHRVGHPLRASEVSAYWRARAFEEISAAPAAALERTGHKLRLFWHQYETPDNDNIELVQQYSPALRLPVVWMGMLFPLALLGAVTGWRNAGVRILAVTAAAYCAAVVAFFVLARFRAPIVPILAVLAAAGLGWLGATARAQDWQRLAAGAALVAVAALWAVVFPDWLAARRLNSVAISYHNLAEGLVASGDVDGGIRAYEQAVATNPTAVVASMRALGDLYLQRGDYRRAEQYMRRVLEIKPNSKLGREALVRLYETMRKDPHVNGDATLTRKLADAYRAAGRNADGEGSVPVTSDGSDIQSLYRKVRELRGQSRWAEAIATLEEAIRVGPYDENAHYMLGALMEAHATPEEMVQYWSTAVTSDPKPQTSYYFWAIGLERGGDLEAAVAKLQTALGVDPAHEMSHLRWAEILERQGRVDDALAHCRTATEIHPDFRGAHETCARLLHALGHDAEAREEEERARASNPNTPRRYVYWARYLIAKGRTDAAVAELERALRENPRDAEARALLTSVRPDAVPPAPLLPR